MFHRIILFLKNLQTEISYTRICPASCVYRLRRHALPSCQPLDPPAARTLRAGVPTAGGRPPVSRSHRALSAVQRKAVSFCDGTVSSPPSAAMTGKDTHGLNQRAPGPLTARQWTCRVVIRGAMVRDAAAQSFRAQLWNQPGWGDGPPCHTTW